MKINKVLLFLQSIRIYFIVPNILLAEPPREHKNRVTVQISRINYSDGVAVITKTIIMKRIWDSVIQTMDIIMMFVKVMISLVDIIVVVIGIISLILINTKY